MSEIQIRTENDICVMSLSGNLAKEDALLTKDQVKETLDGDNPQKLLFNLEDVSIIDSSGIGMLVWIIKQMKERKGKFAVCYVSQRNQEVFRMTRLTDMMEIYDTEEDALEQM